MISVTGATNYYSLQPSLLEKHSRTLSWLSATMHWKGELRFYQMMLNDLRPSMTSAEFNAEIDDLENQVLYFLLEGIEDMRRKLRHHESMLARMLEARAEWDTQYFKEHDALMESAAGLAQNIDKLVDVLRECLKGYAVINK
jgi:hypothetical protein